MSAKQSTAVICVYQPKVTIFKLKIIPLALLIIGNQAIAQQVPVTNGQMQQIPTVPKLQAIQPKLAINKQTAPAMANAEQIKIVVKTLSIKGARAYSEAELIAVTGFQVGTELNLNQLQEMAARISRFYHQHGYFAAQAYLPAQDIRDDNLSFMVMEGH